MLIVERSRALHNQTEKFDKSENSPIQRVLKIVNEVIKLKMTHGDREAAKSDVNDMA